MTKNEWLKFLLILGCTPSLGKAARELTRDEGAVGNGGDTVQCEPTAGEIFDGKYSLDYVATYNPDNKNSDVVEVASWQASAERLQALIDAKIPAWSQGFTEFRNSIMRPPSPTNRRGWSASPAGLVDIKDERLLQTLPKNCLSPDAKGSPRLIQTVIRRVVGSSIFYDFDSGILQYLKNNRALQFSFLMMHEFLWDKTGNNQLIRDINRYLHSRAFETDRAIDVMKWLESLRIGNRDARNDFQDRLNSNMIVAGLDQDLPKLKKAIDEGAQPWIGSVTAMYWEKNYCKPLNRSCPVPNFLNPDGVPYTELDFIEFMIVQNKNQTLRDLVENRKAYGFKLLPRYLEMAVFSGNNEALEMLSKTGELRINPDLGGQNNEMIALYRKYFETVSGKSVAFAADAGLPLTDPQIPFWVAEKNQDPEIISALLSRNVVFTQAREKNLEYYLTQSESGMFGWRGYTTRKRVVSGPTPLVVAAFAGNAVAVRSLLRAKVADVNATYAMKSIYEYDHSYYDGKYSEEKGTVNLRTIVSDSNLMNDQAKNRVLREIYQAETR